MLKRLALALPLALLPALTLAQAPVPDGAPCDGSEMRRAEHRRDVGRAMFVGTAAADIVAFLTIPRDPSGVATARSHFGFVAATVPIALTGILVARQAYPGDSFWQRVITRLKVGETRAADVQLCLHRPLVSYRSTAEERWTYLIARPSGLGGTLRTVSLTFRDSVLANVEQTEVTPSAASGLSSDQSLHRRHGFCSPPISAAIPVPSPADTTPGAVAAATAARMQAEYEASMSNMAYMACMVSDTAP